MCRRATKSLVIILMDSGARQPEFESWLLHLLVQGLGRLFSPSVACCPIFSIQVLQVTGDRCVERIKGGSRCPWWVGGALDNDAGMASVKGEKEGNSKKSSV